jgi:ATP-dependent protease HslVU (ClpYQ) peptidase subunit
MTAAIAYGDGQNVWMAADSMTNIYTRPVLSAKKIARLAVTQTGGLDLDPFALISTAGDGGLMQLIRKWTPPEFATGSDVDAWAQTVAEAITMMAIANGMTEGGRMGASCLLGFQGRVWTISHMYAVSHPDNISAIGSGEGPAIGALDAQLERSKQDHGAWSYSPENMLIRAMKIAINRDQHVAGEIQIETA